MYSEEKKKNIYKVRNAKYFFVELKPLLTENSATLTSFSSISWTVYFQRVGKSRNPFFRTSPLTMRSFKDDNTLSPAPNSSCQKVYCKMMHIVCCASKVFVTASNTWVQNLRLWSQKHKVVYRWLNNCRKTVRTSELDPSLPSLKMN